MIIREGNEIIGKIEVFRLGEGRLPVSLNEIGIIETESGPYFYEKRSNDHYVLYYNIGFDDLLAYHSRTKEWNDSY